MGISYHSCTEMCSNETEQANDMDPKLRATLQVEEILSDEESPSPSPYADSPPPFMMEPTNTKALHERDALINDFHKAIKNGNKMWVTTLMDEHPDIDFLRTKLESDAYPLQVAVLERKYDIIEYFLEREASVK